MRRRWFKIRDEQTLSQGKTMNSHNTKAEPVASKESTGVETDHKDVRVLRSRIVEADELSIADDFDNGGDPYNSTGQHVIIKPKKIPDE
jgi:hypothetical protein